MSTIILEVRYPINIKTIISMVALSILNIWQVIYRNEINLCNIILAILFLTVIAVNVIRRFLKLKTLRLDPKSLSINSKKLEIQDISLIYINSPKTIGIKPKKHKIVPISLYCEIIKKQKGIDQIVTWAKSQNIEIEYRYFIRWI